MGDIAVVCHGAGETEAQRQGGLAGWGSVGRPVVSRLRVEPQSIQGRCKRWFCLPQCSALPLCIWRVGGWGDILVRTEVPGERAQLHGERIQDLLGRMRGPGPLPVPGGGGGLGVLLGEGDAAWGTHWAARLPDSGCRGHVSSETCLPPALSECWHFPPKLESTLRLKLISLPLHNNSCSASP